MRETFGSTRKAFAAGLEPEPDLLGADYLWRCHNARATEIGLRPHETLDKGVHASLPQAPAWPFPRVWTDAAGVARLFYEDAIYCDNGAAYALDRAVSQPAGLWHVAELGRPWIAANGASLVYHVPYEAGTRELTGLQPQSVCAAGNTFLVGGLDGEWLVEPAAQRILAAWRARAFEATDEIFPPNADWVMWWNFGGGAADEPFAAELSLFGRGDLARYERVLLDYVEQGRIGFMCTHMGAVKAILPLGSNSAAVYCAKGVGMLESVYGEDGVTRFRWRPVLGIGVGGRGHACGNHSVHFMVDTTGRVWSVSTEGAKPLGYRAYVGALAAAESVAPMVASYDPQEAEAYFAGEALCYVLRGGTALSSRNECPTGLQRIDGGALTGYYFHDPSLDFEAITARLDYNQTGLKTVQTLQCAAQDVTGLQLGLDYRYGNETAWRHFPYRRANPNGTTYPLVTAREFRLKIKGTLGIHGRIDYAYHRWKFSDRRDTRGLYGQS